MKAKRRARKPADPMAIARRRAAERLAARDPGAWGVDAAALALPANAEVEASRTRAGEVRARRRDVFDTLHARGALTGQARDAVRRLQADIAVLHRTETSGRELTPKVDASRRPDDINARRLAAGERIAAALRLTGPASAHLLSALAEAETALGHAADWRAVVQRLTGETLADAQGAVLRAACDNLAGAYLALDREKRAARPRPGEVFGAIATLA